MAHIHANSDIGPRADTNLTPKERVNYSNFILLCANCHKKVDSAPEKYTVECLKSMKKEHENKIVNLYIPKINFSELAIVIKALISNEYTHENPNFDAISIDEKIKKNDLTIQSKNLLKTGIARSKEVEKYLSTQSKLDPKFPLRLKKAFKDKYEELSKEHHGDDLFNELCDWMNSVDYGDINPNHVYPATLVVLSYLFEICEVFEK